MKRSGAYLVIAFFGVSLMFLNEAMAIPVVDNIASGDVRIQQSSGSTQVNQSSRHAIINWRSFNIDKGERTHFQQPPNGVALNRIDPKQGASQIFGTLTATGRLILVNQAGIYFGPSAYVDVGGLIASTTDISDANFLSDKYIFDKPSSEGGSIVNQGTIIAKEHGLVALVGTAVQNDGTIQANLGSVVLASGNKFTIDLVGDDLIHFTIDEAASSEGISPVDRKPLKHGVSNTGNLIADGGRIIVSAASASSVLDHAINMSGVAQAQSVSMRKGEIILSAGTGRVTVSGRLIASGRNTGESGGLIKILGQQVYLKGPAEIDASGDRAGGNIYIGGNFRGSGPEPNATHTYVEKGVTIKADALVEGNGGQVVVWADNDTRVYGNVSAQAGVMGGDGGTIETSGHYLDVNGISVSTLAENGKNGTWLLDPTNIYIASNQANATAAGMSGSDSSANTGSGVNPKTFSATGAVQDSLLTTGSLVTGLNGGNVIVSTTNASGTGNGTITLVDPFSWGSTTSLTLNADSNIEIAANITGTVGSTLIVTSSGSGNIYFNNSPTINVANQTYNSPVILNSDTTLISSFAASLTKFGSTIDGPGRLTIQNDHVSGTGEIQFLKDIGLNSPLSALILQGNAKTTVNFNNRTVYSVITDGNQSYSGPVVLSSSLDNEVTFQSNLGSIFFGDIATLDGNSTTHPSYVFFSAAQGGLEFNSSIGATVGLMGIAVNAGSIQFRLNASQVVTRGKGQIFPVTLSNVDMNFSDDNSLATGFYTSFQGINGNVNISVNNPFGTFFNGDIGNVTPLASLSATGPVSLGQTISITTKPTGVQTFSNPIDIGTNSLTTSGGGIQASSGNLIITGSGDNRVTLNSSPLSPVIINLTSNGTLSLAGNTSSQTWSLTGNDAGSISGFANPFTFSGISYIEGGSGGNTFNLNGFTLSGSLDGGLLGTNSLTANNTTNTWTLVGTDAGTVTGIGLAFTNIQNITGGSGNDDFILITGSNLTGTLNGGGGTNTLTGQNTANTWNITGSNSGTVGGITGGFSNIQNLIGGDLADEFTLSGAGSLSGTIDGGAGANKLTASNVPNKTWVLTGTNAGTVPGTGGFSNIQTIVGSGTDSLTGDNAFTIWVFTGSNSGTVDQLGFSGIENFTGGNNADFFVLNDSGSISGTLDGGVGFPNRLTGRNIANTWNITGSNSGTVGGITGGFSNIQNLVGGSAADDFTLSGSGTLIGGGINGAAGANTLTMANGTNNTWLVTGTNIGTVTGIGGFNNIQTITGGSGNDGFTFNGGSISGALNGGGGTNFLTANNSNNLWTITGIDAGTLTAVTVPTIGGGFSNIQNIMGGSRDDDFTLIAGNLSGVLDGGGGSNTLTGRNVPNIWTITGNNSGSVGGITGGFSNIQNLVGGSRADDFTLIGNSGLLTGIINGGAGDNKLTAANPPTNIWRLTDRNEGTVTGTGGFKNIQTIVGGSGTDSLTGNDAGNTWRFTGSNAGTVSALGGGFSGIENFTGGSSFDSFVISGGSVSGFLNGGGGDNSLTGDNNGNTWTITGSNSGTLASISDGFSNIQSLIGGTGGDTFIFNNGSSLNSITGASSATNIMNFLGNAITLRFTSTRNGTALNSSGSTVAIFSNFDQSTGPGVSSVVLPTNLSNTLEVNSNGNATFNDPFNFSNTNNGFTTFQGNATDTLTFLGFTQTPTLTQVGSSNRFTTTINGTPYFFIGFGLTPSPGPTPPVPPVPPVPPFVPPLNSLVIQANFINQPWAPGIPGLYYFLYESNAISELLTAIANSPALQPPDIKVNWQCGVTTTLVRKGRFE